MSIFLHSPHKNLYTDHFTAHATNLEFEKMNLNLTHEFCTVCRQVSTNLYLMKRIVGPICKDCHLKRCRNPDYKISWLPTWRDKENIPQYHLPECLDDLREGEKLLIQRVSSYVPIRHMKGGAHGSQGHVCSFPKDIQPMVTELPRKKVEAIRVVRRFVDDRNEISETTFLVRKSKILTALQWLKEHNGLYKDIVICETNLDWMNSNEEVMLDVALIEEEYMENLLPDTKNRERDNKNILS